MLQIMTAIAGATATTAFTEEEIDHFGDTFAYTTTDPQSLGSGTSSTALSDALVEIMGSSKETGLSQFAADQTTNALSSLSGLKKDKQELDMQKKQKGLRTSLLQVPSLVPTVWQMGLFVSPLLFKSSLPWLPVNHH